MSQTRVTLAARVSSRLSVLSDDGRLATGEIYQCIADALASLSAERDWPWLQTLGTISLVAGTDTYNFPANCVKLDTLSIEGKQLHQMQYTEILRYNYLENTTPTMYCIIGQTIKLLPVPDAVKTLDVLYYRSEPLLTADGTTILCPDHFSDLVVAYACVFAAMRLRDQSIINVMVANKDEQLRRVLDSVVSATTPPRIVTRWDTRE